MRTRGDGAPPLAAVTAAATPPASPRRTTAFVVAGVALAACAIAAAIAAGVVLSGDASIAPNAHAPNAHAPTASPTADPVTAGAVRGLPRALYVHNKCSVDLVLGVTGGSLDTPCSAPTDCDAYRQTQAGSAWTNTSQLICDAAANSCFFAFNFTRLPLAPGAHVVIPVPVAPLNGSTTWSGNMWASTGCSASDPNSFCDTGVCGNPDSCGGSSGAQDPVSLAEFTLSHTAGSPDYYDISLIPGGNVPVSMGPVFAGNAWSPSQGGAKAEAYWCTTMGATEPQTSASGVTLNAALWAVNASIVASMNPFPGIVSAYSPFVTRVNSQGMGTAASQTACATDADCSAGEACGVFLEFSVTGVLTGAARASVCGAPLVPPAFITPNGACALASPPETPYSDNVPYACAVNVPGKSQATFESMWGCIASPTVGAPSPFPASPNGLSCPPLATPSPTASPTRLPADYQCYASSGAPMACPGFCTTAQCADPASASCCTFSGSVCGAGDLFSRSSFPYGPVCDSTMGGYVSGANQAGTCTCSGTSSNGGGSPTPQPTHVAQTGFRESGYQQHVNPVDVCGCPEAFDASGLAPFAEPCVACDDAWYAWAFPWMQMVKESVCSTCYTFPYDDPSSTATCALSLSDTDDANVQSYEIIFCPS